MTTINKQSGFSAIELLITLFIAAMFLVSGYQLYNLIIKDGGQSRMQARAGNIAYDYLQRYKSNTGYATNPCTSSTPLDGSVTVDGLSNVIITINVSCPFGASSPISKVTVDVKYDDPQQIVSEGTFVTSTVTAPSPYIQTITAANCPSTRTQVQDARDSHTYWVQKLADNKCWMLTNLGYAGGGTNTYSDTKTLANGTGGSSTYTVASYYVTPSTTNFTTEPTAPSTSADGTGQYGYLYNFCGANGGQTGNVACTNTVSTAVDTAISICPAGWRLPTSNGGEFTALNTAINGGSTATDAGLIGTPWLAQRGGYWDRGFYYQGSNGSYWPSTGYSAADAYNLSFYSTLANPNYRDAKTYGYAVRCIAV